MKPLLTSVDAVLFDLDGTLVETNIDFSLMKRRMLDLAIEAGVDSGPLERLDILAIIDHAANHLASSHGLDSAAELRERAMAVLEGIELVHARQTQRIPFAGEILTRLRGLEIGVGIVTRNCRSASEMSLNIAGITPDVLVCREDSLLHKPHPEPIVLALGMLGARAGLSIMVGDHLMDVQCGKAAGVRTIGFLRETRPRDFFDDVAPDFIAHDLEEVLSAIIHRDS